jgi:branched-chain amino acid transport system substrate-binding protein
MRSTRRSAAAAIAAALLVMGLTSCGDDAAKDADSGAAALKGPPVRLFTIQQLTAQNQQARPEAVSAIKAAVQAVNAEGGLNGRPIEVEVCDDKFSASDGANCARQAVSGGYAAVVGSTTAVGDAVYPVLEAAKLPNIGPFAINRGDFSSEISFPLFGAGPSGTAGLPYALKAAGASKIGIAYVDIPTASVGLTFIGVGAKGAGVTVGDQVPIPLTTTDITAVVSAAAKGNDGVGLVTQPVQTASFLRSHGQQGLDIPVAATAAGPVLLKQLGESAEALMLASAYAPLNADVPGMKQFNADMDKYAPDAERSAYAITSWLAIRAVQKIVAEQGLETIDKTTLMDAFSKADGLDLGGVVPKFSTKHPLPLKGLNRIFTPYIQILDVKDGHPTAVTGKWFNPFDPSAPEPAV